MRHAIIAAAFQLLLLVMGTNIWVAAFAANSVFFMREVTQAEYRCIEKLGGRRAEMGRLEGLNLSHWNRHSIDNIATPMLATFLLAVAVTLSQEFSGTI